MVLVKGMGWLLMSRTAIGSFGKLWRCFEAFSEVLGLLLWCAFFLGENGADSGE